MKVLNIIVAGGALLALSAAWAQGAMPAPQNVLQLSAEGSVEVQQDLLSMTLVATREGTDAATVQSQLKSALDTALAQAKPQTSPGQMAVRTGNFSLSPRYAREGKISGWQGRAEVHLEGRDFPRIAQTAGAIASLNVEQVGFSLSREARDSAAAEARKLAIASFKQKAGELARGFGFSDYSLREITVNDSHEAMGRPRMMASPSKALASAEAAVPVEAGKATVSVSISGSVQLR